MKPNLIALPTFDSLTRLLRQKKSTLPALPVLAGLSFFALSASATVGTIGISAMPPVTPQITPQTIPSWGAAGLLQAAFGLAVVIGLIFLCAWGARRLGLQKSHGGRLIKIVSSTALGQRERVVVVEVGSEWLVLGVTPGQIQSLHTMPAQTLPVETELPIRQTAIAAGNAASVFAKKLRESLGRK